MKKLKLLNVVGARPNLIKIAPLIREMKRNSDRIHHRLVHTGQHYDENMSEIFFKELEIQEPDYYLEVGSGSHAVQTANIMIKFEKVCIEEKPDWVIVVGDVNSTLACTLVAKKIGINVAHIEAGLRSFDMSMPEEINRKVTDSISDLLFTPSEDANENLKNEGVHQDKIKLVGNIMIDSIVSNLEKLDFNKPFLKMGLKEKDFIYVTLHRPSNVDKADTLKSILENLSVISNKIPIVFPVHPRTKSNIEKFGLQEILTQSKGINTIEPASYLESISYAKYAKLVVTDSGGLQEETTFLGTECLTLRPNSERPVTISHGTNKLTKVENLFEDIEAILSGNCIKQRSEIPFWDGKTSARIVDAFL